MIGDSGAGTFIIDGSTLDLRQTPDYATTPRLNIGASGGGVGTVAIVNGGHLIMDFAGSVPEIVGNGTSGNLIVSGAGSSLTSNLQLAAGSFSNTSGTITISNGASVTSKFGNFTNGVSGSIGYGTATTANGYATVTDPGIAPVPGRHTGCRYWRTRHTEHPQRRNREQRWRCHRQCRIEWHGRP